MRLIRLESDLYDSVRKEYLYAGVDYVVTQLFAGYYATRCDGFLHIEDYPLKPFSPDADWNGKRILVHRSVGGAGDLLFITPLLRAIKERWPACHITFYCYEMYHWFFAANPHVDECIAPDLPITPDVFEPYDAHIELEDAIEYSPLAKTHIAVDVFAAAAGMEVSDKTPVYSVPPAMVARIKKRFPKKHRRVGVALKSRSVLRDYPLALYVEVVNALLDNSVEVVLLGGENAHIRGEHPLLLELSKSWPPLSWEEAIAFMTTCDLVLGPDSSSIHFAGVLNVPSLGLYAAFPSHLRISTQPATQAIQATGPCAPCFAQDRGGVHFPPLGPCRQSGQCDVLAGIPPRQIVDKVMQMIAGAPQEEAKEEPKPAAAAPVKTDAAPVKKTCLISQPCGVGDILFIQKIILHFASIGYRVVAPILERYAWMRYYIRPHPDVEYPLIAESGPELKGDFKFADAFFALGRACMALNDPASRVFAGPVVYNGADPENGFVFLPLGSSYLWRNERMMPAKYNLVELDPCDWPSYVHLKRRTEVERELYYDVLGLDDDSVYTLVNENASTVSLALDVPGETVRMREIEGFTLFDWSLVVERAAQIVTIDTSLVILAEVLKQRKPLHMVSRYVPPSFDAIEDVLTLDWTLALTPADLNVSPVFAKPAKRRFWRR